MAESKLVNVNNFYNLNLSIWRSYKNFRGPNAEALDDAAKVAMASDKEGGLSKLIKVASQINELKKSDSFIASVIEDSIREATVQHGHNGNLLSLANVYGSISMGLLSKAYHVRSVQDLSEDCDQLAAFFSELAEVDEEIASFMDTKIVVKDHYGVRSRAFTTGEKTSQVTKGELDPALAKKRLDAVINTSAREMVKLFVRAIKPYLVESLSDIKGVTPTKVEEALDKFIDEYGL